jgi:hypothetical protein
MKKINANCVREFTFSEKWCTVRISVLEASQGGAVPPVPAELELAFGHRQFEALKRHRRFQGVLQAGGRLLPAEAREVAAQGRPNPAQQLVPSTGSIASK